MPKLEPLTRGGGVPICGQQEKNGLASTYSPRNGTPTKAEEQLLCQFVLKRMKKAWPGLSAVSQDSNCICKAPCTYFHPPSTTSPFLLPQSPSLSTIVVLLNFKLIVYCQCVDSENNSDFVQFQLSALKKILVGYSSSY